MDIIDKAFNDDNSLYLFLSVLYKRHREKDNRGVYVLGM